MTVHSANSPWRKVRAPSAPRTVSPQQEGPRSQGEMLCREVVVAVESSHENPDDSARPLVSFLAGLSQCISRKFVSETDHEI